MRVEVTGKLARRRDRQGLRADGDRDDRLPRRHRLRARVHGLGDSRAVDGAAHDAVQHGDRSGRDDGAHRRRRDDRSLSRGDARRSGREVRLQADDGAEYAAAVTIDGSAVRPVVSWGTNPGENAPIDGVVPYDADAESLAYMDLRPVKRCAASRSIRRSSARARTRASATCAPPPRCSADSSVTVPTIVTPGSQAVRRQAEREGLHDIFQDAGALWTHSSCGPCLGMSMGVLAPGTRCVSSSNRNFPGRMGDGGRVHLAAPVVVAASAILGRIASPPSAELAVTLSLSKGESASSPNAASVSA